MTPIQRARALAALLFTAVLAGNWDVWWHGAVGRDTFWEPPHILLYASILGAIIVAWHGWRRTTDRTWKRLCLLLLLSPLAAPFDELWHRLFGVEPINSPSIIWSPPHLLLVFSIGMSAFTLFPLLAKDDSSADRQFFTSLSLASIFSTLLFLTVPIEPTGPFHLLGFAGAGVVAMMLACILLLADRWMTGAVRSLPVMAIFLLLQSMTMHEGTAPGVNIQPHDHSPQWLIIMSFLAAASVMDSSRGQPLIMRLGSAAFIWSAILYTFSPLFFLEAFQYGWTDTLIAIVASMIGAVLVSMIFFLMRGIDRSSNREAS